VHEVVITQHLVISNASSLPKDVLLLWFKERLCISGV
jgi:hypothetical protein